MKKIILTAMLAVATLSAGAANVGVSVNIGEPGYYGNISIGNYPSPQLLDPNPIIIQRAPGVALAPIYLRVPAKHSRNWHHYCGRYHACGRPVYFVRDSWYRDVYAPRYRDEHHHHHSDRHERRHHRDRDE